MRWNMKCVSRLALAVGLLFGYGTTQSAAVELANIVVVNGAVPQTDPPASVTIPAGQNTAGFTLRAGAAHGQIPVQIGASAADDFGTTDTTDSAGGVMIASISEHGRDYPLQAGAGTERIYAVPSMGLAATGTTVLDGFWLLPHRAGNHPANAEILRQESMNANMGAAYFPFSEGWVGASFLAEANNAPYTRVYGSPGITLTNVDQDFFNDRVMATTSTNDDQGDNRVTLPGVEDTRRQGILFPMHAKNEDNYAVASPTVGGDAFNLTIRGSATDGGTGERDPLAFVFIPVGTPNVTMATIHGGSGQFAQPTATIKSGNFTIAREANGRYRLSIPGQSPSSGVLITNSTGSYNGNGGLGPDNFLTYEADGNDWIILSQDSTGTTGTPMVGNGQQSANERNSYFSFAFMSFATPPTAPGPLPALRWTKQSRFGYNANVIEVDGSDNNDDGTPGTYSTIPSGTPNLDFQPLRANRADFATTVDGAFPAASDGVMFATVRQGLRDNTSTGGTQEYGMVAPCWVDDVQQWEFATHTTDPLATTQEHNINYSVAFFGANSGFKLGNGVDTDAASHLNVSLSDAGAAGAIGGGVLMVNPNGYDPVAATSINDITGNYVTVAPKGDNSGWNVDLYSSDTQLEHLTGTATDPINPKVNWVYLPYTTSNLVAGRVNANGSIVDSTSQSAFSLNKTGTGEYTLTINGRTPDQGMLILNSNGVGDSVDNHLVYEPAGNSFKILGLDMVSSAERGLGELVDPEDTAFQFAFIDFITPPGGNFLAADFNNSGSVDGIDFAIWKTNFGTAAGATKSIGNSDGDADVDGVDFLAWQRQRGSSQSANAATTGVPEPHALALVLTIAAAAAARGRRRA